MARQQTTGTCALCKATFPKASMTRHLTKCLATHDTAETAGAGKPKQGQLFHLVVEGKYQPRYWLHLEVPATARMGDLDHFLRRIWLECCGHMSAFRLLGQKQKTSRPSMEELLARMSDDWRDPDEVDMEDRVGKVLTTGAKLAYEYDFGSTTELVIKVVGEREGSVGKAHDVRLLARNEPPHIPCGNCKTGSATIIDMENSYDESGWLCEACGEKAGLIDRGEMTLPVVNSPRTGVCGYSGD